MTTTDAVQITLKGASFGDVINQAKSLILAAHTFEMTTTKTAATKTKGKVQAAALEETDEETLDEETTEVDETETAEFDSTDEETTEVDEELETAKKVSKAAKAKSKKLTSKDVNDAAMNYAKIHGRAKTFSILQKKLKVKSILELDVNQYETALKLLAV